MKINITIGIKNAHGWRIGGTDIHVYPQNDPNRSSYAEDIEEADFEVVDEEVDEDVKSGKSADCSEFSRELPFTPQLPEELKGEKAGRILMKLYEKKILDEKFQPLNLTGCQKGYLARRIADKLGITHVWVTFGGLWNMNPGTLRIRYNEALNNKNTVKFEKIIHSIFNKR